MVRGVNELTVHLGRQPYRLLGIDIDPQVRWRHLAIALERCRGQFVRKAIAPRAYIVVAVVERQEVLLLHPRHRAHALAADKSIEFAHQVRCIHERE